MSSTALAVTSPQKALEESLSDSRNVKINATTSVYHGQSNNTSPGSTTYKVAFDDIIAFVKELSHRPISADECDGTTVLAGPFTPGGLLILLLEPLDNHPWAEGIDRVILHCPSLALLCEGVLIASDGTQSLTKDVSVMDRWPFLPKRHHMELRRTDGCKVEVLEVLVLRAICAKKPDVILCMGKEAKLFLARYETELVSTNVNRTNIIYTQHPSRSANHVPDCHRTRHIILHAIQEACQLLKSKRCEQPERLGPPKSRLCDLPLMVFNNEQATRVGDIIIVQEFLDTVVKVCFVETTALPVPCIRVSKNTKGSYFTFTTQQRNELKHALLCEDAMLSPKNEARIALIPILLKLNGALKRNSYFQPLYEADWDEISEVLSDPTLDLEQLCLRAGEGGNAISPDVFSVTSLFDELPFAGFEDENAKAIARMERITWRMQIILPQSAGGRLRKNAPRRPQTVGSAKSCKCTRSYRFSDLKLTAAFRAAYIPTHECYCCM